MVSTASAVQRWSRAAKRPTVLTARICRVRSCPDACGEAAGGRAECVSMRVLTDNVMMRVQALVAPRLAAPRLEGGLTPRLEQEHSTALIAR